MTTTTVVDQHALVHTAVTLSYQGTDSDGEAADPGVVTITLTRADGTALATAAATVGTGTDPRTYAFPLASNTLTDILTAVWKVAGATIATTKIGINGRVYMTSAALRAAEPAISNVATYTAAELLTARQRTEMRWENICGVAFVPRFSVDWLVGSGSPLLQLDWPRLRSVRWARIYSTDGTTYTSLTAAELAAIGPDETGQAIRGDFTVWTAGHQVEIGYEHGHDHLPQHLEPEYIKCVRHELNLTKSQIPDRAMSWQPLDGGVVYLSTPGIRKAYYGIPSVDEALHRMNERLPGVG